MDPMPERGTLGVQRGASWLTLPRCHDPKARRFALPAADRTFGGFRSCAL
jgi:formylglycine-generating enzyme required for sulfatase activity